MPKWYSCPHSDPEPLPTSELGAAELLAARAACPCRASGGCNGQLRLEVTEDDPSPPGVALSPGHYTYVEIVDSRDHTCDLTVAELDAFCAENAADAAEPDEDDWL